jgi:cytochrome c-type biogenesis protein CcmH/NrfF
MTTLPLWLWVAGVVVLGITLAYGLLRNRTRTGRSEPLRKKPQSKITDRKICRPNSEPPLKEPHWAGGN